jgi:hypothetical protein
MAAAKGVYWVGANGNFYIRTSTSGGVKDLGRATADNPNIDVVNGLQQIPDPAQAAPTGGSSLSGGGAAADPDAGERDSLKASIKSRAGDIDAVYNALFGDLDNVVKARDSELTTQYGGQRTKATEQFTDALPQIDQSYAALGSYDSTQRGDSRGKAKKGYEDTLGTIGANEKTDRDKLGSYKNENAAKFTADRDSAKRNIGRVDETTDVGALRSLRNDIEGNLDTAGVTRATLGTNGSKTVQDITGDNGRADAAINALDSVLKSSLGSDVKAAAVKAVVDSAGLSDEDKKKVQATYGNVYAEQQAL